MTESRPPEKHAEVVGRRIAIAALIVGILSVMMSAGVAQGGLTTLGILGGVAALILGFGGLVRGKGPDRLLALLGGIVGLVAIVVGLGNM